MKWIKNLCECLRNSGTNADRFRSQAGIDAKRTNKNSGGYPKSAHLQGRGADIRIYGPRVKLVLANSLEIGFTGIGFSQKGLHKDRFIHLDTIEREAVWSY